MRAIVIVLAACYSVWVYASEPQTDAVKRLLEVGRLVIHTPVGFAPTAAMSNPIMSYEYALQHAQKPVAARYAIRPIPMVGIDYQDPHNAAPQPNHLFPMLFQTLVSQLSAGTYTPSREFSRAEAQRRFHADWAATALLDSNDAFTSNYAQTLLLALHSNDAADAYVMILFNDYETVKPEVHALMESLSFRHD